MTITTIIKLKGNYNYKRRIIMDKIRYVVIDGHNHKKYGPFNFYKTAHVVANKIDDRYGEVCAEIKRKYKNKLISVKRLTH
jgi:hypothetical protein